jgi:uncharacterized membrane protein YkvA (DUF1232 family)
MSNEIVKNGEKLEDFYQRLRIKINNWIKNGRLYKKTGKWTDPFVQYLLVLPDLAHLVIKLFFDKEVPNAVKGYLLVALAYLVSPIDIVPDFIPVAGFIDDLLIMVVFLNKIINSADAALLNKIKSHWAGEDDVFMKVKEIVAVMNNISSNIPKSLYKFMKRKK